MSSIDQNPTNTDMHMHRYKLLVGLKDDLWLRHTSRVKIAEFCSTSENTAVLSQEV